MLKRLQSLFRSEKPNDPIPPSPAFDAKLDAKGHFFVIGDIHGMDGLVQNLMEKCPKDAQLIFVGDLVDRGPQSREVMERVRTACDEGALCLMGNHEKMMLDFIDRPTERGGRWLRFGGLQTLDSFGVRGVTERANADDLLHARDAFRSAIGSECEKWLRDLPTIFSSGNLNITHAGADPLVPMDAQLPRHLLWGNRNFDAVNRGDGEFVLRGHVIHDQPHMREGRIEIDVGSYATGRLAAAHIEHQECHFIEVQSS